MCSLYEQYCPHRDEAIRRLQTVESEIRRLGVRNEACPDSDVDVLVEFVPTEKTFNRFMAPADLLEDTLEHRVEVVTPESLSPLLGCTSWPRQRSPSSRVTIWSRFSI